MDASTAARGWMFGAIVALVLGLAGGYWYGVRAGVAKEQAAEEARRKTALAEAVGAVNPFADAAANPFEKNPANPYEKIKVNPFE